MKKILILTSILFSLTGISVLAANTPFKVKVTEEQHSLSNQQLTDLLKVEKESSDTVHEPAQASSAEITANPLNDPFLPQTPRPTPPAAVAPDVQPDGGISSPAPPAKQKPAVQKPSLTISGIIWNSDRPQAIVNNQVVDVGTTVGDTTVLAINKTGIDVLYSGEKFNIPYN